MRFFQSIRWRLVFSFTALAVVVVGAVGLLVVRITEEIIRASALQNLQANAQAVAKEALPLMKAGQNPFALNQLVETAAFLGDVRVRVLDPAGRLITDSGLPDEFKEAFFLIPSGDEVVFSPYGLMIIHGDARPHEFPGVVWDSVSPGTSITVVRRNLSLWGSRIEFNTIQKPEVGAEGGAGVESTAAGAGGIPVEVRAPIGAPEQPFGYVELRGSLNTGTEAVDVVQKALLISGFGAVLLAVGIGLWISSRLTSPLLALQQTAERMGTGDLSVRAAVNRNDEIGDLAAHFNQMAGQLESSFEQVAAERDSLRRFIADASHELRTPITALKNFVSLLQGPASQDPEAQVEFLAESQIQIERLTWITENLLNLSRLDAGLVDFDLNSHDLREIVHRALAGFRTQADEKQITLATELPVEPVFLTCDAARLELALLNLLDNAVKYTPPGGIVKVGASQDESQITCWVSDTGPGIAPEDMPHIYERFYRGRNQEIPGSGLGLSIVKSLVEAQQGTVIAADSPGEGTVFTLRWQQQE